LKQLPSFRKKLLGGCEMSGTIYSLIPPFLAIFMVILTRRVLLSLGIGIISAALLLQDFSVVQSAKTIWESAKAIVVSDGEFNTWNMYIIFFLFILGIITSFISISGGSKAFGEWALKRVKTRTGAQLIAIFLGILVFIDDYFNALAVGQVSRPLTDRYRVSRAKLAYYIDSTSAPVCVVAPVSSWGAYIIGLISTILAAHSVVDYSPLSAFVQMIPMNLYVIAALLMVFFVAFYNINIGPMKQHEERAMATGEVVDRSKGEVLGDLKQDLPVSKKGTVGDLVYPIISLVIGTVLSMLWTGYKATEGKMTLFTIFENTDVPTSLLYGGIFGLIVMFILLAKHLSGDGNLTASVIPTGILHGLKSMLPAVSILVFAWVIVDLIGQLKTGEYLAGIVQDSNLNIAWLPVIVFLLSGIMAFSTGTSWGTFGIMLPIAGEIAAATDISLLLPALSAVLAGSVFGDHCSPISDTTILSSTGAGSHHIDHVLTQLPYAMISAFMAALGYIVLGLTGSTIFAVMTTMICTIVFSLWIKKFAVKENISETV
jgi:tetracycline resistance efflux pump